MLTRRPLKMKIGEGNITFERQLIFGSIARVSLL